MYAFNKGCYSIDKRTTMVYFRISMQVHTHIHTPSECIETWNLFVCNIYSVYGFFSYQITLYYTLYTLFSWFHFWKFHIENAFKLCVCTQNTLKQIYTAVVGYCCCCCFIFINSLTSVHSKSVHIHAYVPSEWMVNACKVNINIQTHKVSDS